MISWLGRRYVQRGFRQVPCGCSVSPSLSNMLLLGAKANRPRVWCLGVVLPQPQLTGGVRCWSSGWGRGGRLWEWVVGFTWHIDEPVNRNFPLYVADTSVNLFMDCISCYLWNLISNCFLLCSVLPTSAITSNTGKCWFFGLAIYFFWFLLVLPCVAWFESDRKWIRNKYENQYRNYLC